MPKYVDYMFRAFCIVNFALVHPIGVLIPTPSGKRINRLTGSKSVCIQIRQTVRKPKNVEVVGSAHCGHFKV